MTEFSRTTVTGSVRWCTRKGTPPATSCRRRSSLTTTTRTPHRRHDDRPELLRRLADAGRTIHERGYVSPLGGLHLVPGLRRCVGPSGPRQHWRRQAGRTVVRRSSDMDEFSGIMSSENPTVAGGPNLVFEFVTMENTKGRITVAVSTKRNDAALRRLIYRVSRRHDGSESVWRDGSVSVPSICGSANVRVAACPLQSMPRWDGSLAMGSERWENHGTKNGRPSAR